MNNEIRYNLTFCTEDGTVVTLMSDKIFPDFPNKVLGILVESKEMYALRVRFQEERNLFNV